MSVNLVVTGNTYVFPETGEENWGDNVTDWATAVTNGMLQKSGGTFTLTAEVDFGALFGIKSLYYKSRGSNPSSTGILRLANTELVAWRNAANSADFSIALNASNVLAHTAPIGAADGSAANPSITISSDADNGFYLEGANSLGFASAGAAAGSIASGVWTIGPASPGDTIDHVLRGHQYNIDAYLSGSKKGSVQIDTAAGDFARLQILPEGGNAGYLVFTERNVATYTAIGHDAASDTLKFRAAGQTGSVIASLTSAGVFSSSIVSVGDGAQGTPAVTNTGDENTGIYFPAADEIGLSTGGTLRVHVTSSAFDSAVQAKLKGSATNDNADAGDYGEAVRSYQTWTAGGATTVWADLTSISLTAGDWDVSAVVAMDGNGFTASGNALIAISVNSGTTTTDHVQGDNELGLVTSNIALIYRGTTIPSYRLSLSGTTTVYLKTYATFSAGSPLWAGRISARRVR